MVSTQKKAKIIWQCRRGMLELDLILQKFLNSHLDKLTDAQITSFESLLTTQDPDLYAWLMGYETPIDKDLRDFVKFIQLQDNTR